MCVLIHFTSLHSFHLLSVVEEVTRYGTKPNFFLCGWATVFLAFCLVQLKLQWSTESEG